MILQIPMQRSGPEIEVPARAHDTDAAYDLRAAEPAVLFNGDRMLVRTGICAAIPEGFAGLILPRSGLAIKYGVTIINAPGLIDPGYRGEIQVALTKLGHEGEGAYCIQPGDRIAQLLLVRTQRADFVQSVDLGQTERAAGGFGSTGVA